MADEANPVTMELLNRTRDVYGDNPEAALAEVFERMGGEEVITQALNALTIADFQLYPQTALVREPQTIRQAILSGFTLGVAACDRVREIETQMRDMGME